MFKSILILKRNKMKQILFIILLVSATVTVSAQTSAAEAKAAYLLAEEAFGNADYKKAITYLQECKASLGQANSKILYLQIMSELELSKTDVAYLDALEKSIAAFYKAPDVDSFNEEKALEVMKLKIKVKEMKAAAIESVEKTKADKEKAAQVFQNWTWQDWPLNLKLTELKALKKGDDFFSRANHGKDPKAGIEVLYNAFLTRENTLQSVFLKDDMVVGYRAVLAYGGTPYKQSAYSSEAMLHDLYRQKVDSLTNVFGFSPQTRTPSGKFYKYMKEEYYWTKGDKTVSLLYDADISSKTWAASIYIDSVNGLSN